MAAQHSLTISYNAQKSTVFAFCEDYSCDWRLSMRVRTDQTQDQLEKFLYDTFAANHRIDIRDSIRKIRADQGTRVLLLNPDGTTTTQLMQLGAYVNDNPIKSRALLNAFVPTRDHDRGTE